MALNNQQSMCRFGSMVALEAQTLIYEIKLKVFNLQLVRLAMVAKALKRGAYHVYYS